MNQTIITGILVIIAAAVPQIIQLFRTNADHTHDLRRDHYRAVFEYRTARLNERRIACHELQVFMDNWLENKETLEEANTKQSELIMLVEKLGADLDATSITEISESVMKHLKDAQDAANASLKNLQAAKANLDARQAENKASFQKSVEVLNVDVTALPVVRKCAEFMKLASKLGNREETNKALGDCVVAIATYLHEQEMEILQPPTNPSSRFRLLGRKPDKKQ